MHCQVNVNDRTFRYALIGSRLDEKLCLLDIFVFSQYIKAYFPIAICYSITFPFRNTSEI